MSHGATAVMWLPLMCVYDHWPGVFQLWAEDDSLMMHILPCSKLFSRCLSLFMSFWLETDVVSITPGGFSHCLATGVTEAPHPSRMFLPSFTPVCLLLA
jgi:hypothetical protein